MITKKLMEARIKIVNEYKALPDPEKTVFLQSRGLTQENIWRWTKYINHPEQFENVPEVAKMAPPEYHCPVTLVNIECRSFYRFIMKWAVAGCKGVKVAQSDVIFKNGNPTPESYNTAAEASMAVLGDVVVSKSTVLDIIKRAWR